MSEQDISSKYSDGVAYNYYAVAAKCGHVGKDKFIPVIFGIKAVCGEDASLLAREMPHVKHDSDDAILFCVRIDEEKYRNIRIINKCDPYLVVKNNQEHSFFTEEIMDRTMDEPTRIVYSRKDYVRGTRDYKGKVRYSMGYEEELEEDKYSVPKQYDEDFVLQNYLTKKSSYNKKDVLEMLDKYIDTNMERLSNSPIHADYVNSATITSQPMSALDLAQNDNQTPPVM